MIDDDEVLGSCMHMKDGKHRRVIPAQNRGDSRE